MVAWDCDASTLLVQCPCDCRCSSYVSPAMEPISRPIQCGNYKTCPTFNATSRNCRRLKRGVILAKELVCIVCGELFCEKCIGPHRVQPSTVCKPSGTATTPEEVLDKLQAEMEAESQKRIAAQKVGIGCSLREALADWQQNVCAEHVLPA